jgi:hypothetical protein
MSQVNEANEEHSKALDERDNAMEAAKAKDASESV